MDTQMYPLASVFITNIHNLALKSKLFTFKNTVEQKIRYNLFEIDRSNE